MPLDPSEQRGVFEPDATAAMGVAFDDVCKELHVADQSSELRELIATLIIAAAGRGELDPVHLRTAAVTGIAVAKSHREADAAGVVRAAS